MNLQFLSRQAIGRLFREVANNTSRYLAGSTEELISTSDCRVSKIEVSDPPSLLDNKGDVKSDVVCAKLIYQWLSALTPVVAADERLWTYLSHVAFAEYMVKRWQTGLERAGKKNDVIIDRWFFKGEGARTKMHNGISRLWWFAHVTYDSKRANPFELTEVLLSLQDIQTAFLERSLGLCSPLLQVILEVIQVHSEELDAAPERGDIFQEWAKDIRLRGGAFLLDAVPKDRLTFVVEQSLRNRLPG